MFRKRACEHCKNTDMGMFINDCRTGEVICKECGFVQLKIMNNDSNVNFVEEVESVRYSDKEKGIIKKHKYLIDRHFPLEMKDDKRKLLINEYCDKLDVPECLKNTSYIFLKKHFDLIDKVRPNDNLIAVCIILSCSTINRYINVGFVEKILGLKNVNSTLRTICKMIGFNQKSLIINNIPYLISMLKLPFKFEKKLGDLYKVASMKNPSMGAETRMALCCYRLLLENREYYQRGEQVDLTFISNITYTSENSLKTYISGKIKNSLFNVNDKKRHAEVCQQQKLVNKKIKII